MYLDPRQFDAYKELDPSQQAVIDQLAESLTRQSWSSRKRLYASRVLRMGALTMATEVPVAIAAGAPNWVGALLGVRFMLTLHHRPSDIQHLVAALSRHLRQVLGTG